MRYAYAGPGPHEYDDGGVLRIVRPGDELEFDADPPFGPWIRLAETPQEPPADSPAPSPAPDAASPAPVSLAAPAPAPEGM